MEMETTPPTTQNFKWMKTAARSGKLKHQTFDVPANHVNREHASKTQRQYKVRFKSNIAAKRGIGAARKTAHYDALTAAALQEFSSFSDQPSASVSETGNELISETGEAVEEYAEGNDHSPEDVSMPPLDETDEMAEDCFVEQGFVGEDEYATGIISFQHNILSPLDGNVDTLSTWTESNTIVPKFDRRFYLQYYIEKVVPRLMPLWAAPDNPFICIVVPASMDSPILMNAITAISAYHQELEGRDSEHSEEREDGIGVTALRHKQKVLSLLRENLSKPDVLQDPATLAACMLMQTFEVLCSGISGWDHWLKGATLFIQMRGQLEIDLRSSNSWIRLIKSVVAVETFAGTSADLDMVVSTKYWEIYRRQREAERSAGSNSDFGEDQHFEQLIGCPAVVVYALGQMLVAIRARREADEKRVISLEWLTKWNIDTAKLEDLLLRWKPTNPNGDRVHLTESFRHASLVYYCHHVRCLPFTHTSLQFHVKKTFEHLLALGTASQLEGIALWPTMMAAIDIDEQKSPELMDIAIERIRLMASQKRDPLYKHAEEALNMIWNRRISASSPEERLAVRWEDLNYEMDWKWCMV